MTKASAFKVGFRNYCLSVVAYIGVTSVLYFARTGVFEIHFGRGFLPFIAVATMILAVWLLLPRSKSQP